MKQHITKKERKIVFMYNFQSGRVSCDCRDLHNWLLDYNLRIASRFLKKIEAMEKEHQGKGK